MQMHALLVSMLVVGCAAASARGIVWVEAERFDDRGGWTADA